LINLGSIIFKTESFFNDLIENFSTNVEIFSQFFCSKSRTNCSYSSSNSYILRQTTNENSVDLGLTIELFDNGNLNVILPVPTLDLEDWDHIEENYLLNYQKF